MNKTLVVIASDYGREHLASYAKSEYEQNSDNVEVVIAPLSMTVGESWNRGVEVVEIDHFDYLHLTYDDMIPVAGWQESVIKYTNNRIYPTPVILHSEKHVCYRTKRDGVTSMTESLLPFMRADHWKTIGPSLHINDFATDWLSTKAWTIEDLWREQCPGYAFECKYVPWNNYGMLRQERDKYLAAVRHELYAR